MLPKNPAAEIFREGGKPASFFLQVQVHKVPFPPDISEITNIAFTHLPGTFLD
jgi:hypothetical protein